MFFAATSTFLSSAFVPRSRVGRTLSAIAAGRAVGVAVSAALAASGAPFALLLLMVALDATLAGPYRPAQAALVPGLARAPRELVAMATGLSTAKTLSQALGAVAGGVLLAVTSPFAVFGGAAAVFVAAASITAGFARSAGRPPGAGRPVDLIASLRQTVRLSRQPGVTNILTVSGLRTFVRGMWVAIAVIASLKLLHAGSSGVGLLSFAAGIGSIVAAPISARLVRLRHLGTPAAVALVGCGVPLAIIAGVPVFGVALAVVAAWGVGMAVADVATTSLLHRLLEAPAVPRVTAAIEAAKLALEGLGGFVAPLLVGLVSIRAALVVAALPLPVVVVSGWRTLHRVDDEAAQRARTIELLHAVPLLRHLDVIGIDGLVGRLQRVVVAEAGTTVVAQGEAGDTFYVVESGSAEVRVDGYPISRVVAGDAFGERALLRSGVRTASVVSREPMVLLSLSCDDFLAAVLGVDGGDVAVPVVRATIELTPSWHDPAARAAALARVSLLSHLDASVLRTMAEQATVEDWAAGSEVVRQGDVGERFYVLLAGAAEVRVDGQVVNQVLPGDQFGDIALLHGVPRTATVVVTVASTTMSIGRGELMAPVRTRLALG